MELLTIKQASEFASQYLGKNVTSSNIAYLIQYGRLRKIGENGSTQILKNELLDYYKSSNMTRENSWKKKLGDDLNWALSFDNLKEADTTKHVHRLHPYKGKFIPQLVEYFLDEHLDEFKKEIYSQKGDIVLDPFCGSGTMLLEANELGMHALGVDVSAFNSLISNVKIAKYDFKKLEVELKKITNDLEKFLQHSQTTKFERELLEELNTFNNKFFPVPEFKYKVKQGLIGGDVYGNEKAKEFLPVYKNLIAKYKIELLQPSGNSFLEKWFSKHIRQEIDFVFEEIKKVKEPSIKKILTIILSRTMRSCRATTHADLATLKEPITTTYYCGKHGKICKPLFSILKWWQTYSKDTVSRLREFDGLRTNTFQYCLTGDSRTIDIFGEVERKNSAFADILKKQKIKGIFSSPPYVGLIDYHEQHAYSYDLFGFERKDELEIGQLSKGQSKEAQKNYVDGIANVLNNCKKYLADDYNIFLVANDKYNLYPRIAEKAGMKIVEQFKRPVLNRTEKDKGAYAEIVFRMRGDGKWNSRIIH